MPEQEQEEVPTGSRGRKRGGPLRIDRSKIIDAARRFDPQTMTMQAVADELGVDRKALNYHVTDRENLLRLVAQEAFDSAFADAFGSYFDDANVDDLDWRDELRAWAVAVRDSMVATGVLATFFRIETESLRIFEPVERVLQRLHDAGFDDTTAGRAVVFATHFAMGIGRDLVLQKQLGAHPQTTEVRGLFAARGDAEGFERMRGMIAAEINGPSDIGRQFDFELEVFIRGLEETRSS